MNIRQLLGTIVLLLVPAFVHGQTADPVYLKTEVHNLPDAPSSAKAEDINYDKETGQWVATPHVKVFDKWFLLTHGAFLAANITDIEVSVRGKCAEGGSDFPKGSTERPTRKDLYTQDMIVFSFLTGMDIVFKKWIPGGKYISLGAPIYGTVVHTRGAVKWFTTPGCM